MREELCTKNTLPMDSQVEHKRGKSSKTDLRSFMPKEGLRKTAHAMIPLTSSSATGRSNLLPKKQANRGCLREDGEGMIEKGRRELSGVTAPYLGPWGPTGARYVGGSTPNLTERFTESVSNTLCRKLPEKRNC